MSGQTEDKRQRGLDLLKHADKDRGCVLVYHWPSKDKEGREVNGRIAATTVMRRLPDGKLVVGITRARLSLDEPNHPKNEQHPRRITGQHIAAGRVNRYLKYVEAGDKAKKTNRENVQRDLKNNLIVVMTDEEYVDRVFLPNPFIHDNCPFGAETPSVKKEGV